MANPASSLAFLLGSACLLGACETAAPSRPLATRLAAGPGPALDEQVRELSRASRPAAQHEALAALVGDWEVEHQVLDSNDHPTAPFHGHAAITRILGGRFVRWDLQVDFGGTPGTQTGFLGYDLRTGEYQLLMISDLATGMIVASGRGDLSGAGLVFTLEQLEPRSGARVRARSRLRLLGPDRFVLEVLQAGPDGVERPALVTKYARVRESAPTK